MGELSPVSAKAEHSYEGAPWKLHQGWWHPVDPSAKVLLLQSLGMSECGQQGNILKTTHLMG